MAQQMPGGSGPKVADMGMDPEKKKKGVDPRDLIGHFHSKRDIFDYLLFNRKPMINPQYLCLGQYYMRGTLGLTS